MKVHSSRIARKELLVELYKNHRTQHLKPRELETKQDIKRDSRIRDVEVFDTKQKSYYAIYFV